MYLDKILKILFFKLILIVTLKLNNVFSVSATTTGLPNKLWNASWIDIIRRDLLANYDKVAKPSGDAPTNVTTSLTITHLDIHEETGNFIVWGWIAFNWVDSKLKWDPLKYGNLTRFHAAQHEIWQPDILLYNSATIDALDAYGNYLLLVFNDGSVVWVPQVKFNSFCSLNLRMWPYDVQECSLVFGSWVYSGIELNIDFKENQNVKIERFVENHEWSIQNITSKREVKFYDCCKEAYISLTYNITLERRSPMYSMVVVTPAISLTFIILSIFWLPPQSGEKILLNGFNFLVLTMYLIYFAMKLPIFAFSTPLIVIFYSSSLLLVGFSIIISIVVLCLARTKHEHKIPPFIGTLLRGNFGRILGVSIVERKKDQTEMQEQLEDSSKRIDENFLIISHTVQYDWILFATAIDRIAFIFYCLIFLILAASCCLF